MPTTFHHIAFAADPARVGLLRGALHEIVTAFDFRTAARLRNAWANPWLEAEATEPVDMDPSELRRIHGAIARIAGGAGHAFPELPVALPTTGPRPRWEALLRGPEALAARQAQARPPHFDELQDLWANLLAHGMELHVERLAADLEALVGRAPAFEPVEDIDVATFAPLPVNPIHLYEVIGELAAYCIPPGASSIGIGAAYTDDVRVAAAVADLDPYTPAVPTPEELAHAAQPRRAWDQWPDPAMWCPEGLFLDPLIAPEWVACAPYAETYTRPVVSGLMRGPVGWGVGGRLRPDDLDPRFSSACERVAEADRAVITWVAADVDR